MPNPTRCAGCRYLRRRCSEDCMLAPYFPPTHPERFAYVQKIFGASNVTRILQQIPVQQRAQAADSIAYEAYWRFRDPVYGCVGVISQLQQEIGVHECELIRTQALLAMHAAQFAGQEGQLPAAAAADDDAHQRRGLRAWEQYCALPGDPHQPPSGFT